MKKLLVPLAVLLAFVFAIPSNNLRHVSPAEASASGATLLTPANYDMEAPDVVVGDEPDNYNFYESSYETGTPPANNGFGTEPDCSLSSWQVSGTVTPQAGGPGGCYARTELGATLTSSLFAVPTDVQTLTFQMSFLNQGYNMYMLKVLYNGSSTTLINGAAGPTSWTAKSLNFTTWAGKSIQLQFYALGRFGIDDVGVMHVILPQWETPTGVPELGTGGIGGTYAKVSPSGYTLTSAPFTISSSAQNISWYEKYLGGGTNMYSVYVLIPDGSGGWKSDPRVTALALNRAGPSDWGLAIRNVTMWQGQTIRLQFYIAGGFGFDDIGVQHVTVQGWSTPGVPSSPVTLKTGGPWGQYADVLTSAKLVYSPLSIPSNATKISVNWKPNYSGTNLVQFTMKDYASGETCYAPYQTAPGPGDWRQASFQLGTCVGKNITLEVTGGPDVGVDNIAVSLAEAVRTGSEATKDPVDTASGAFSHQHTDLIIPGRGVPLEFTRYYSSQSNFKGSLAYRWSSTYDTNLTIDSSGNVTVRYPQGSTAYFAKSGSSFIPPNGVFDTLVLNGDGTYKLTTATQLQYKYSSTGKLTSIADRNGSTTTVSYDGNGHLASVTDSGGRSLTFTTDENGRITQITDPLNRTVGYEYDSAGDLVTVTDVKGGESQLTYSGHRLLTITDSLGHIQTTNIYDASSRVVEQTDALGGVTCIYYGSPVTIYDDDYDCPALDPGPEAGQTVVVDPRGNPTTYDFDWSFRTTKVTDAAGGVIQYGYDGNGNRNSVEDQNHHTTGFTFDSKGNMLSRTDALDRTTSWQYNANNDVTYETDALGRHIEYQYSDGKNLTKVRFLNNDATEISHIDMGRATSGNGDLVSVTDGRENTTSFAYDDYGNQTSITDPLNNETDYTYDLGGRKLTETDPLSHTTTYTYDNQNNVETITDALDHTTSMTYDAKGNLSSVMDANGNTTERYYDDADHLTEVVDALDNSTTYDYDENGNRTSFTDANGETTTYVYDELNRLESVTDPLSHTTTYEYDAAGNQTGSTDAEGLVTTQIYDAVNQLTRVEHWDGETLMDSADYAYDAKGNRTSVTDPNGNVTAYEFDNMDRLATVTDPLDRITEYGYDANGNRTWLKDANHENRSTRTDYTYDELNRLTDIQYPDVHYHVGYGYDAAGRRTSMTDVTLTPPDTHTTTTTTYDYDDANRVVSVTRGSGGSVSYAHDDAGNRTSMTYPDDKVVNYTFDELNRLATVSDWHGPANVSTYGYDDTGNLVTTSYPTGTGIVSTRTYDDASRLTSLVNSEGETTLSSYAYTLDNVGNRTQMVDESGTRTYSYDALYRLLTATYPDTSSTSYTYDAAGNRQTLDDGVNPTVDYTYDDGNELTNVSGQPDYSYDANGNWKSIGSGTAATWWAVYDYENKPVRIGPCHDVNADGFVTEDDQYIVDSHQSSEGDEAYDFHYDLNGDGAIDATDVGLVSAQAGSNTFCPTTENIDYDGSGVRTGVKTRPVQEDPVQSTTYAWDAAASLPVIIQETTNGATTSYVYGLDLLSMSDDSDVTRYFLQDGLGSTTGLTDETGAVIGTFDYDVFGALRGQTGDADTDWRFTGEQNDPTTARSPYYLRARYYDPSIGRLLSRDPWPANGLDPQSRNPYSYVYNGPTLLVDPYGYFGLGDLKKIKDAVTDCVGDPKECAENAGQKIKQGGEAAGNWAMDNRQYIVDAIETGSGMVATASCTAGLLGGAPVCVISSSIYVGASVVEAVWIAETPAQRISAVGSSILGACGIRAGRVEGLAFAGLNGAWDALTHVDPAEAPNSRGASGPSNAGNSCVEPIGAEK